MVKLLLSVLNRLHDGSVLSLLRSENVVIILQLLGFAGLSKLVVFAMVMMLVVALVAHR